MENNQPLTKKDLEEVIDNFAGMVNAGFQEVHNNFKAVHERINHTDAKIDTKIDSLKTELISVMDEKITASQTELITVMDEKITASKTELIAVMDEKITASKMELLDSNDALIKKLDDNRQEQAAIIGGHKRIDDTLLEHEERITRLERVGGKR